MILLDIFTNKPRYGSMNRVIVNIILYKKGIYMSSKAAVILQVLKMDKDIGLTLTNNEFYEEMQTVVEADPLMGKENQFTLFPYSIVDNDEDTSAMLVLLINRLNKPIQSVSFDVTLGNNDGEYVCNKTNIDLPEAYLGVLETDGVVPVFLQVEKNAADVFYTLDPNDMLLELENFQAEFVK